MSWQPRSDAPTLAPTVRPSIILGTTTLESTLTALSTVESSRSPATTLLPAAAVAGTTTAHPVTGVGGDIVRGVAVRAPGQTGTGFVRIGAGCCRTADGGEGTYEQHLRVGTLVGCIDLCQEHAQCTGIEYIASVGLCEVHVDRISHSTDYASCACMIRPVPDSHSDDGHGVIASNHDNSAFDRSTTISETIISSPPTHGVVDGDVTETNLSPVLRRRRCPLPFPFQFR